jgi:hypothetical protein
MELAPDKRSQKDLDLFLASIESKLRGPFSSLDLTKTIQTPALRDPLTRHEYLERIALVMGKTDKITQSRIVIALLGLLDHDASNSTDVRTRGGTVAAAAGALSDLDNDADEDGAGAIDQDIYNILQQAQEAPTYEEWVRICASLVQGIMYEEGHEVEDGDNSNAEGKGNNASSGSNSMMGKEARKLLEKTTNEIIKRVADVQRATEYEEDDPNYVASDKADADPVGLAPYRYALLNSNLLERVVPETQAPSVHFTVNTRAEVLKMDARLEKAKADEERDHEAKQGTANPHPGASSAASNGNHGARALNGSSPPTAVLPGVRPGVKAAAAAASTSSQRPKSSMFMPAKKPAQVAAGKAGKTILHARKAGAAQALLMKGRAGGGAASKARVAPTIANAPGTTGGASNGGASGSATNSGGVGAFSSSKPGIPGMNRTALVGKGRAAALLGQRQQQQQSQQHRSAGAAKSKMVMMDVSEVADLTQQREHQQQQNPSAAATGKRKAAPHDDAPSRPTKQSKKATAASESSSVAAKSPAAALHEKARPAAADATHDPSTGKEALASAALTAYLAQQQQQKLANGGAAQTSQERPAHDTGTEGGGGGAASTSGGGLDWKDMLKQRSNRLSDDDRRRIQLFFVDQANPTPNDGESVHRIKLHEERAVDPATGLPIKETYYLELDYDTYTSRQSKKIKRYKEGQ